MDRLVKDHNADRARVYVTGKRLALLAGTPPLCPLCAGRPLVGVLRPLGDGAKRSLVCSLCATEWEYRRIVRPACGEEGVDKLPVYVAGGPRSSTTSASRPATPAAITSRRST